MYSACQSARRLDRVAIRMTSGEVSKAVDAFIKSVSCLTGLLPPDRNVNRKEDPSEGMFKGD